MVLDLDSIERWTSHVNQVTASASSTAFEQDSGSDKRSDATEDTQSTGDSFWSLIDVVNKVENELLSDIDNLSRKEQEVLRKPSVINKYFPPNVYTKLLPWHDLMEGYKNIKALEERVMPERMNITVMMAVPDPPHGPT